MTRRFLQPCPKCDKLFYNVSAHFRVHLSEDYKELAPVARERLLWKPMREIVVVADPPTNDGVHVRFYNRDGYVMRSRAASMFRPKGGMCPGSTLPLMSNDVVTPALRAVCPVCGEVAEIWEGRFSAHGKPVATTV